MHWALVCTCDPIDDSIDGLSHCVYVFETFEAAVKFAVDKLEALQLAKRRGERTSDADRKILEEFQGSIGPTEYFDIMPIVEAV